MPGGKRFWVLASNFRAIRERRAQQKLFIFTAQFLLEYSVV
jgi:hypothetical protein